ncbi:SatD family protein [Globicatella sp. PHS-GS-PNBC-21-1553]|uniref:SatD family protein n=1 Tax=Globicatella sp. PHS-GS-PNBC-21-1553 TaxID=2885764 RepID=UPI00298EFD6C|nr:SatD family protein [Globicatella sp. PHS-GS-PNBC-21-1553]WPC08173.1 SatD family protein [Globicatella sp. PHS-GS-PNBC-21-1553]
MQYIAMIGDVIESKSIKERQQSQDQLNQIMKQLNEQYQTTIVSNFTITTGDEFQALLTANAPFLRIMDEILMAFRPYKVRFGFGLGEMMTEINNEISIGADGPAYWHARAAIEYIHEKNDYGMTQARIGHENTETVEDLNHYLALTEYIRSSWVTSQNDLLAVLLANDIYQEDFEHQMIAAQLNINPSALSKRLKGSGIKVYLRGRNTITDAVHQLLKEEE